VGEDDNDVPSDKEEKVGEDGDVLGEDEDGGGGGGDEDEDEDVDEDFGFKNESIDC